MARLGFHNAVMRNPDRDDCDVIRVNAPVKLKTIVTDYPGHEFVWACCRDLSLAVTPGSIARNAGINAAQSGGTFTNFDKNTGALNGISRQWTYYRVPFIWPNTRISRWHFSGLPT